MSVSINVNGLSLCHKGSDGRIDNTLPDVCKTPDKGIPIPYKNRAFSKDLVKGTTSCFADGGHMVANFGSEFAVSIFDEAGSMGGVVSGTNKAEADWITYSPDVFFEKKPACRLTDKMFMNHRNTASLGGLQQAPLEAWPELLLICALICKCDQVPTQSASGASELKQECVEKALLAADDALGGKSPIKPEIPYNMTTNPPTPILSREAQANGLLRATRYLPRRMQEMGLKSAAAAGGVYEVRIPDAVIMRNPGVSDLTERNLKAVVEIKFNNQPRDADQIRDYSRVAGGDEDRVVELSPAECMCGLPETERVPAMEKVRGLVPAQEKSFLDKFSDTLFDTTGVRLAGAALVAYIVISEVSRIFPPRNAIPVP